ncbi:MAG: NAD(P)H-hydrate dehydratase [Bacteroidales bacterium]|jgi:NAD(P)H-hydrate epimerase|nr:NAD(P)H-hydrate dehydratase [Bacteroidales bacterium]
MYIYSASQIKSADAYTIEHEPISSINLMERAAVAFVQKLLEIVPEKEEFYIFCGSGNNGGDGFAVARLLSYLQKTVHVLYVEQSKTTDDCQTNFERFLQLLATNSLLSCTKLETVGCIPEIPSHACIIDALFGSGLQRLIAGELQKIIVHINSCKALKIAVDIPSGLFCDALTSFESTVFEADYTITFQYPKLQFLFAENSCRVGEWHCVEIGLHHNFEKQTSPCAEFVTAEHIALKQRNAFSHKGTFGHALLIAGSFGKMGAATLAARSCISSGCGLLTTHIPRHGNTIMQIAVPEAMTLCDENEDIISSVCEPSKYSALGVGPGIGTNEKTYAAVEAILQSKKPTVLDADALNILACNRHLMNLLHENCIITPHPGEFDRLTHKHNATFERFETQKQFAIQHNCTVILKGRYTCTCMPDGHIFFNSSGNPGMATAGSGDVLTGIILSLLAQQYSMQQAAVYGVFIHGLAGDFAKQAVGEESLTAQTIIENVYKALLYLRK